MLLLSLFWALIAWNLYHPWHGRPSALSLISFIFGMMGELLGLYLIALQALVTLLWVWWCGLGGLSDALGLAIHFGAWIAIGVFYWRGQSARDDIEQGITQALGEHYRDEIPAHRGAAIPELLRVDQALRPFKMKPADVTVHKDIVYGNADGHALKLDVYHHRDRPENAPVLFQIHGGGWMEKMGDKNQQALPLMYQLASHGWVCVSVDYRLSPSFRWPAHIQDCKSALIWTKQNIADYNGDADFIVATGGSAGGHLSALLALSPNDAAFQPEQPDADTSVQGLVTIYGVHDFTNSRNQRLHEDLDKVLAEKIIGLPVMGNEDLYQQASPLYRVTEQAPPTLIVHGASDTLVPVAESRCLYEAFKENAVEAVGYAEIRDAQHAFELLPTPRCQHVVNGIERFATVLHERYLKQKAE